MRKLTPSLRCPRNGEWTASITNHANLDANATGR